jgi:two-component sensor histidine kinase
LSSRYREFSLFLYSRQNFTKAFFLVYLFDIFATTARHQEYFQDNFAGAVFMALTAQLVAFPLSLALINLRARFVPEDWWLTQHSTILLLLVLGFGIGVSKVLIQFWMLADFNDWLSRIASATLGFPVLTFFAVTIIRVYQQISRNTKALRYETELLTTELESLKFQVEEMFRDIQHRLTSRVVPAVSSLRSQLEGFAGAWDRDFSFQLLSTVERLGQRIVRRESHDFYRARVPSLEKLPLSRKVVGWVQGFAEILRYMRTPSPTAPLAILPLVFLFGLSACANDVFLLSGILVAEALVLGGIERRIALRDSYFGFVGVLLLTLSAIGYLMFTADSLLGQCDATKTVYLRPVGFALVLLLVFASSFYASILRLMEISYAELSKLKVELMDQVETSKRFLSSSAAEFANTLHGEIQSGLAGISMALQLTRDAEEDPNNKPRALALHQKIVQRFERIERKVDELLAMGSAPSITAQQAFSEVQSRWQGLLSIDITASPEAGEVLDSSHPISPLIFEVLYELATNSVRHGGAKKLAIKLSVTNTDQSRNFLISAANDGGHMPNSRVTQGLVSLQVRERGGSLSVKNDSNGGVMTTVLLPL